MPMRHVHVPLLSGYSRGHGASMPTSVCHLSPAERALTSQSHQDTSEMRVAGSRSQLSGAMTLKASTLTTLTTNFDLPSILAEL